MDHLGEETAEAVVVLLAVGISPCGHFGKHGTVSFCAAVLQAVVPRVMRLCSQDSLHGHIPMTADKRWKNWPLNNLKNQT